MGELFEKQVRFTSLVAHLIRKAHELGYQITLGEVYRHPDWAKEMARRGIGIANSLHCKKLAVDINLFKDGTYLEQTEDYRPLGEYWESLGGTWGGRFGDGCHFSIQFEGVR